MTTVQIYRVGIGTAMQRDFVQHGSRHKYWQGLHIPTQHLLNFMKRKLHSKSGWWKCLGKRTNRVEWIWRYRIVFGRCRVRIFVRTPAILTEVFRVFPWSFQGNARTILRLVTTASFQILSNSSLISHPTIRHYNLWYWWHRTKNVRLIKWKLSYKIDCWNKL
jgi:hypothetical protein